MTTADRVGGRAARSPAKGPTPPWFGAVVMAFFLMAAAWLLTYTLLDWPWQQRWGAWNYLVAAVFGAGAGQLLRRWRGDPR